MNKKFIIAILAATLTITTLNMAKAEEAKPATIAIIDTAIETRLPQFKDKIVHEVCIVEWNTCPNKTGFMEGPGAAVLPQELINKNGFDHGTQMADIAVQADPNIKIVFIRIVGINSKGYRQAVSEKAVDNALSWVINNQSKFNIQAVSMSQSHHNLSSSVDYCPASTVTRQNINKLVSIGVPVFLPAGNLRDYKRVSWPGCIQEAITISASMPSGGIAFYTNYDQSKTDFFALGTTRASLPNGIIVNVAGTSASTVTAATNWVTIKKAKQTLSYSEIYDLISKTSLVAKGAAFSGKLINLNGALNG